MQTFLPYPSYVKSARVLDDRRLGKQRVECLQILNVYAGVRQGWGNHPITRMWADTPVSLLRYGLIVCKVWVDERGFRDTCFGKMRALFPDVDMETINAAGYPKWFGDDAFHRSHQSNLVRKVPERYGPMFPGVPADLDYVWPV